MRYRSLGASGLKVSPLCLGTMMFGGRTDPVEAHRIIDAAADIGVNFIDTADVYNDGQSERVTGRAIAANRDFWILATKVGNAMGRGPHLRGLSRRWLVTACEASLQRLGVDHIDVYYLHREDPATPLAETVRALGDLVSAGKIRYFGLSNFRSWRIAEICNLCDQHGIDRPVVLQPYYNLLKRMPEVELLPACGYYGLGVVPYSPIARGVLTGKYAPGGDPEAGSRAALQDKRIMETEWRPENLEIAQTIKRHAETRGITTGQFATAWVLNSRFITSVIAGPRTLEQWLDYPQALDYALNAEDEALVDGLVPQGHPSTHGYTDPQYPLEGRQTVSN